MTMFYVVLIMLPFWVRLYRDRHPKFRHRMEIVSFLADTQGSQKTIQVKLIYTSERVFGTIVEVDPQPAGWVRIKSEQWGTQRIRTVHFADIEWVSA